MSCYWPRGLPYQHALVDSWQCLHNSASSAAKTTPIPPMQPADYSSVSIYRLRNLLFSRSVRVISYARCQSRRGLITRRLIKCSLRSSPLTDVGRHERDRFPVKEGVNRCTQRIWLLQEGYWDLDKDSVIQSGVCGQPRPILCPLRNKNLWETLLCQS